MLWLLLVHVMWHCKSAPEWNSAPLHVNSVASEATIAESVTNSVYF